MAFVTGVLAGLVGIGGGLIFSPFMVWAGVNPHVAVATSTFCVIFTSTSTTLQCARSWARWDLRSCSAAFRMSGGVSAGAYVLIRAPTKRTHRSVFIFI